jgi:MFS family permease
MPSPGPVSLTKARFALFVLFGVNFLNYIDRYVLSAVAELIRRDFGLTDAQIGLLGAMFMGAYMVGSPIAGILADRFPRRYFVGGGVLVWSIATFLSGLAGGYHSLLVARSAIGMGEAGFGGVAPTLISDFFPKEARGRMLSFFYVAIPVGSALGYLLGGAVGHRFGWRPAFFVAGAPGLVFGVLAFLMAEPARGAGEGIRGGRERRFEARTVWALRQNASFVYTVLGMSAMTFALGGMAFWFPTFLYRVRGLPLEQANTFFGSLTVVAGLTGTFLGGFLGDRLTKTTPRAYLLVSGLGMILAIPPAVLGLMSPSKAVYLPALFVAEVLVFLNTGPANAVLVNVVLPEIRATAIALGIFVYHLLGDVPSPVLIGKVSDLTGSLRNALLLTCVGMAFSGFFFLFGARTLAADTEAVARAVREFGAEA